ncbi:transposase [Enterococcus sp.]|nr:transposase [Enterococcus sp.]
MKNFRSPNQLLSYAGAEPSVSTSGMNQSENRSNGQTWLLAITLGIA